MKGWRTVLFNVLGITSLVATQYGELLPPKVMPYIGLGLGVGNLVLRTITTTPIGKSGAENDSGSTFSIK